MHFGAIELPAMYIANALGRTVTAPMEAVTDPALRAWFRESRARVGVDIIPLRDARRALLDRLRRGETVGLVNDRDLLGSGIPTPFFGHDAPIPPGAALLAIETGARIYVSACRRVGGGRYIGTMIPVYPPAEGTKRERMDGLTAGIARAFEEILANAPEQWWGAAHPIWPDLAVGAGSALGAGSAPGATP
jgi:KDO2-lipid IV(A) lauroyltransferase